MVLFESLDPAIPEANNIRSSSYLNKKLFFFFFALTTYNPSGGIQGKRGKIITYNEIIIFSEYL